jgi:hypothetical protein
LAPVVSKTFGLQLAPALGFLPLRQLDLSSHGGASLSPLCIAAICQQIRGLRELKLDNHFIGDESDSSIAWAGVGLLRHLTRLSLNGNRLSGGDSALLAALLQLTNLKDLNLGCILDPMCERCQNFFRSLEPLRQLTSLRCHTFINEADIPGIQQPVAQAQAMLAGTEYAHLAKALVVVRDSHF